MKIYLDNAATTMVDPKIVDKMNNYFTRKYGNANSTYSLGQEAKMTLNESRKIIAKSLRCRFDEIVFTSGGTESNNLALRGVLKCLDGKNEIITSIIEHPAILETCKDLINSGYKIKYVKVDNNGFIDFDDLKEKINSKTALVSIMHANNEIGVINDINKIGKLCHSKNILFHTDAVQSFCKCKIKLKNIDLLSVSSHKLHGPKGAGFLFVRKGVKIKPEITGGGQEHGLRSGTYNIPGIVGMALAVNNFNSKDIKKMVKLRDKFISGVFSRIKNVKLNGPVKDRLCNNINISFKGCEGESVGAYLDSKGICTSTGSACASMKLEPSHVLTAIGLSHEDINSSIRFSLSKFTTEDEIDYVLDVLPKVIEKVRKISGFR